MHLRLTCTPEHHCTSASEASLNYGAELWNGFDCSRLNWKGHLTQQCTSHSLKITANHRSTFRWKIDRKMLFFPPSFIFNPITHFSTPVYRQQLTQCNSYTNALRFSISHVGNTNCTPGASCCGNGGSRADTHSHRDEGIFLHAQNVLMCRVCNREFLALCLTTWLGGRSIGVKCSRQREADFSSMTAWRQLDLVHTAGNFPSSSARVYPMMFGCHFYFHIVALLLSHPFIHGQITPTGKWRHYCEIVESKAIWGTWPDLSHTTSTF